MANIECAEFPIRVKLTPDGSTAVVSCAMSAEVVLIDVETREVVRRVPMNETEISEEEKEARLFGPEFEGAVPVGVLIPPAGGVAYVACTNADVISVIDLAAGRVRGRLSPGASRTGSPGPSCRSPPRSPARSPASRTARSSRSRIRKLPELPGHAAGGAAYATRRRPGLSPRPGFDGRLHAGRSRENPPP